MRLALLTVAWNTFEGLAALILAFIASSVALCGFGLDSLIETLSAIVVAWRFMSESKTTSLIDQQRLEKSAARCIGSLLLILALYIAFDSLRHLLFSSEHARESWFGVALAMCALIVMPLLSRAKYKTADALGSTALKADAFQSLTCAWLAGTTLLGLMLNASFGWSWADPTAALLFVPAIIREGLAAFKGDLCQDCH